MLRRATFPRILQCLVRRRDDCNDGFQFFSAYPNPDSGTNPAKRTRLINKIKEGCSKAGSGVVILFVDEAQRMNENEYEWLRDVHDHLDRIQIKLFTFLVGQKDLLAIKTGFQRAGMTQIVARLMVEELAFFGIRNVEDVATCLTSYDQTTFPRGSDWVFTRFHMPQAFDAGYRLVDDSQVLWDAFAKIHARAGFQNTLETPMESFTRAIEIVLKESDALDALDARDFRPPAALWAQAVHNSGYVQARIATTRVVSELSDA